jgi:hypothetical protein
MQLTTEGQIIPGAAPSKAIREKRPEPQVIMPVPADAPRLIGIDRRTRDVMKPYVAPGEKARVRYNPAMTFAYKDVDGQLLGYVLRLHILDEVTGKTKKVPVPVTWCRFPDGREGWSSVGFSRPHPLYGLDKAVNAKVHFYTEGEKTKMAAERFINVAGKTDWAALTWSNGANAVDHADFSISEGKTCIIWRDADDVGLAAQERLVAKLIEAKALNVFTVNLPEDLSKGWDIADAEEEGWTHTNVFDWIENNSIEIEVAAGEPATKVGSTMPESIVAAPTPVDFAPDTLLITTAKEACEAGKRYISASGLNWQTVNGDCVSDFSIAEGKSAIIWRTEYEMHGSRIQEAAVTKSWPRPVGQNGGFVKLSPGSFYAAIGMADTVSGACPGEGVGTS